MRRHAFLAILACGCIFAVGAASRGDAPKPADPVEAQVAALRAQVTEQAAEIRGLREKLAELQSDYQKLAAAPQPVRVPTTIVAPRQSVPPGWVAREFNGTVYYVVPLSGSH